MKEYSEEFQQLQNDYKDIDQQYQNAKNDIDMSRSPEEQDYWQSRADELWNQRDELGYKIDTYDHGDDSSSEQSDSNDFTQEETLADTELDNGESAEETTDGEAD